MINPTGFHLPPAEWIRHRSLGWCRDRIDVWQQPVQVREPVLLEESAGLVEVPASSAAPMPAWSVTDCSTVRALGRRR